MNRTESLLFVERLREGLRLLPDDTKIFAWEFCHDTDQPYVNIHLAEPIEWPAVFDGKRFSGWTEKRICITPFCFAWWADYSEAKGND